MERKIGEIFEYNGEWLQCVEQPKKYDKTVCAICAFQGNGNCELDRCSGTYRSDKKFVIFKKLEKVGEPFTCYIHADERLVWMQEYKLYDVNFCKGNDLLMYVSDYKHKRIEIEIKQNKEDMEDLDKIKVRDYTKVEELNVMEEKKLNLKPFDIQKAREGKPVCTRDGRKARIICFDGKGDKPIIALVEAKGNKDALIEKVERYFINGHSVFEVRETNNDLMMLPEKKEGWVNIYKSDNGTYYTGAIFYEKNDALVNTAEIEITTGIPRDCIDTVKIEWEE